MPRQRGCGSGSVQPKWEVRAPCQGLDWRRPRGCPGVRPDAKGEAFGGKLRAFRQCHGRRRRLEAPLGVSTTWLGNFTGFPSPSGFEANRIENRLQPNAVLPLKSGAEPVSLRYSRGCPSPCGVEGVEVEAGGGSGEPLP